MGIRAEHPAPPVVTKEVDDTRRGPKGMGNIYPEERSEDVVKF
jgi:hypothetical protein